MRVRAVIFRPGRRSRLLVAAAASAALVAAAAPGTAGHAAPPNPASPRSPIASGAIRPGKAGSYDSRQDPRSKQVLQQRTAALAARPRPGLQAFRASLGVAGVLDLDPLTGTPRQVGRLDGFLTGPSDAAPAKI